MRHEVTIPLKNSTASSSTRFSSWSYPLRVPVTVKNSSFTQADWIKSDKASISLEAQKVEYKVEL